MESAADEEQPLLLDHRHLPPDERATRSTAATDANTYESPSRKHVAARPAGGWKAPMAMVLVELFQTGLVLLSKVVIGHGMFVFALVTYRSAIGAAFLFPFALICERDKWREMMSWRVSRWIIFNGIIGYAAPINLYYNGLRDTTSSYAIVFLNMIPLITFILSLAFKMERLKFATVAGSLKIVGVLASVGGAMVINLYKGNELHLWSSILQYHKNELTEVASNHVRGTILLVASSFAYALLVPDSVRGSQSISIQVLVIHGDMLGRRIYDSICWSSCRKRRGRMEAWMESETTNSCVFASLEQQW